jgi:outer membrane receptor protein involved in Fe transport
MSLHQTQFRFLAIALASVLSAAAVAIRAAAPLTPSSSEQAVVLDPFEVRTASDTGFGEVTNSLTQFNVDLNKLPATADILDQAFMDDVAVTTIEDLFRNYAAGGGMVLGTPETDSNNNQPGDYYGSGQFSIRGLSAGVPRRNGFYAPSTSYNTTSSFDIEQVSTLRGSQGLLYGPGGAAGIVNLTTKLARFERVSGEVQERVDQYGSKRTLVDGNWGNETAAFRFSSVGDDARYRRLFLNDDLEGYYGQFAVHLPFRTTLRISGEENHDHRIVPSTTSGVNTAKLNASGEPASLNDPRNGDTLGYLVFTGEWRGNDPITGQPYPRGQILNYPLTTDNFQSIAGWRSAHDTNSTLADAVLDTVWTPWLSSQIGVAQNRWQSWRNVNGFQGIFAPPVNGLAVSGNPLPGWSAEYNSNVNTGDTLEETRYKAFRASILLTNDLFGRRLHSETGIGFDRTYQDTGRIDYGYYQANSDGSLIYNVGATGTNVGRTPAPAYWWDITNGLIDHPFGNPFSGVISVNGVPYVRSPQAMRSPAWVGPNNPLGLENLARDANGNLLYKLGSGNNNNTGGYTSELRNQGWYVANYAEWFGDWVDTLLGVRESNAFQRRPNTTPTINQAYLESRMPSLPSYNAGLNFKILSWLRGYYAFSETFNAPQGANDPLGNAPPTTVGKTNEGGLKFITPSGSIAGSLAFYQAQSLPETFNIGSALENDINPTGLNGAYNGPGGAKNSWVVLDKISRGVELILTAQPAPGWRMRLAATFSDGTNKSDSSYPILYNDQFSTDGKGAVTYTNGQPFLVPIDAPTLAKVATLASPVNPATTYAGATFVPLTTAMINDPTSPYYVWSGQATQTVNGQMPSTTSLYRVLANFTNGGVNALTGATGLPISAIQYNWADPNNYKGMIVVAKSGQPTVGYPLFKVSATSNYIFSHGFLRGFGVGGSINLAWDNRTYFYRTPDQIFHLWSAPTENPQVNAILSYQRKFRHVSFKTQVNINNLFNRYEFGLAPNNGSGWTPQTVAATLYGEPRAYIWTTTLAY